MKLPFKNLLSSVALFAGFTLGSTQANAYPFYYENTYEEQLWAFAEDIHSIDGYAVFLDLFRESQFADDARARLAALASQGESLSGGEIRLLVTKRERGLFSRFSTEGTDPFVRCFDLSYGG